VSFGIPHYTLGCTRNQVREGEREHVKVPIFTRVNNLYMIDCISLRLRKVTAVEKRGISVLSVFLYSFSSVISVINPITISLPFLFKP
jgi:hypothetical protein